MEFNQSILSKAKPSFRGKIFVVGKSWVRILIKTQAITEKDILRCFSIYRSN
jgi:hypothetical protein